MKLKLTPHQANLVLKNIPKGKTISAKGSDLDKIAKLVTNAKK